MKPERMFQLEPVAILLKVGPPLRIVKLETITIKYQKLPGRKLSGGLQRQPLLTVMVRGCGLYFNVQIERKYGEVLPHFERHPSADPLIHRATYVAAKPDNARDDKVDS